MKIISVRRHTTVRKFIVSETIEKLFKRKCESAGLIIDPISHWSTPKIDTESDIDTLIKTMKEI